MRWRAPVSVLVAATLATLVHGLPEGDTFAAFTASDTASGIVRAGSWAAPTPTSTPTPRPSPTSTPTATPSVTPTPDPCIGPPPTYQNMCYVVPSRGTSDSHLPPLPTPSATRSSSGTTSQSGFFLPPPTSTPPAR